MAQDNAIHVMNVDGVPTLFDIHGNSLGAIGGVPEDSLTAEQAAVVANVPTTPGLLLVIPITVPSGANADVDIVLDQKLRVFWATGYLKGAGTAGSKITIKNGATAISDAMDVSGFSDKNTLATYSAGNGDPTTWDDAQHTINAGGTLRVSYESSGADFPGAELYVYAMRVA